MVAPSRQVPDPAHGNARCESRHVAETDAIVAALAQLSLQHQQLAVALAELQRQMAKLERHLGLELLLAANASPLCSESRAADTPMSRALRFLDENLADDISVDALARIAGLSPGRFSTQFRHTVGDSPHRYLVRLRVERARAMLLQGFNPTEAALAVGFYDQSHLTRHMQRLLGITPGALARAYRAA
jgi:AraC-like DNA-binding protein